MLGRLLRDLAPYAPTIIGTFPLGLQIEGSDLDIACSCDDLDAFERALRTSLDAISGNASIRLDRLQLDPAAVVAVIPAPIHRSRSSASRCLCTRARLDRAAFLVTYEHVGFRNDPR